VANARSCTVSANARRWRVSRVTALADASYPAPVIVSCVTDWQCRGRWRGRSARPGRDRPERDRAAAL